MQNISHHLILVVIGLSSLALGGCWAIAAGAGAEGAYVATQENRSATETLTDQRITSTIKAKLIADPDVPGTDLNVDTFKGNVVLRGFVRSASQETKAIEIAQNVSGVKKVTSKISLQY